MYGGIGEVVNTPDCGSGMQGFDPLIPPHISILKETENSFFFIYHIIFTQTITLKLRL